MRVAQRIVGASLGEHRLGEHREDVREGARLAEPVELLGADQQLTFRGFRVIRKQLQESERLSGVGGGDGQPEVLQHRALLDEQLPAAVEVALHRPQPAECTQRSRAHTLLFVRPREDRLAELDPRRHRRGSVQLNAHEEVEALRLDAVIACLSRMVDRVAQRGLGLRNLPPQPGRPRQQLPGPREQEVVVRCQRIDRILCGPFQCFRVELRIRLELRAQLDQRRA